MRQETPEEYLRKAMAARTARSRGMHARKGLSWRGPIDRTTHAMLLRQLYLSFFESRQFDKAHEIAVQAIELDVLSDVLHQDAARAAIASGELEAAVVHLRSAARKSPASRRPFHDWTLGATLFLAGRFHEAVSALRRAQRWGTRDKPLYRGHLLLALRAAGEEPEGIRDAMAQLSEAPCGQGYGRFVLGQLAFEAGERKLAQKYLESFVKRTTESQPAMGIALAGELRLARATLAKMAAN